MKVLLLLLLTANALLLVLEIAAFARAFAGLLKEGKEGAAREEVRVLLLEITGTGVGIIGVML